MHTDAKGKVIPLTVQAKHCIELTAGTLKPRKLFDFTRQSYERKMRILGRIEKWGSLQIKRLHKMSNLLAPSWLDDKEDDLISQKVQIQK